MPSTIQDLPESVREFFEMKVPKGCTCEFLVVIKPMTKEQARIAFPGRPYSKYAETRFGGDELADDFSLLLSGRAVRCATCQAPSIPGFLDDLMMCPECNGRLENVGCDPHKKESER